MQVGAVHVGRVAPCWRLGGAKNSGAVQLGRIGANYCQHYMVLCM